MQNLELKVRCADEATLDALAARALAGGARERRTMWQRDTYFVARHGRLKLREWERRTTGAAADDDARDGAEAGERGAVLIAYSRPDEEGPRYSDYSLSPVGAPEELRQGLARALGGLVVVEKERRLLQHEHTRLHFDRVTVLGAFIELETVIDHLPLAEDTPAGQVRRRAAAEAEHRAVIALLGLDSLPVIAGSYSDLLLARR